jgi:hypothetical protein
MTTLVFGKITIHDFEGTELGNGVQMDAKRGSKFLDNVHKALQGLSKLTTSNKLLNEIAASGKTANYSGMTAHSSNWAYAVKANPNQ